MPRMSKSFSALQRAEIAEIVDQISVYAALVGFSALQRAEIAEKLVPRVIQFDCQVSVLFNEPKLLK